MSGVKVTGGVIAAARRAGVSVEEYQRLRATGMKWCKGHASWEAEGLFRYGRAYCRATYNARESARVDEFRRWLLARVLVK